MRIEKGQDIPEIFAQIKDEFKSYPPPLAAALVQQALDLSVKNEIITKIEGMVALSYASGIMDAFLLIGGDINETISGQI